MASFYAAAIRKSDRSCGGLLLRDSHLDDFRDQVASNAIDLDLMSHLSDRYEVYLTAAILKWLGMTHKRAMVVVGKEGFIDWAWRLISLTKSTFWYLCVTSEFRPMSMPLNVDYKRLQLRSFSLPHDSIVIPVAHSGT